MTVIFVVTKNKYFNVIDETAQTMCMDFINDIVWCIIDCLYQIVPDMSEFCPITVGGRVNMGCVHSFQNQSSTTLYSPTTYATLGGNH